MATEASKKCRRTGKSTVLSSKSTVILDSDEESGESVHSDSPRPSQKLTKNEAKFLAIGKEEYFKIKIVLRGTWLGVLNRNDIFTKSTLAECKLLEVEDRVHDVPPRAVGPISSLFNELHDARTQNDVLRGKIVSLQNMLDESQGGVPRLKDQLLQQQIDGNVRVDRMLHIFSSSYTQHNPSSPAS
ncbi:hypothetical protein KY290_036978 [Solanum tuberosum]|uniref:Uncharacterized protein n=1 Tax=Solanum tuberosum TaxID=4113 RepID=A0ABQ7TW92_SOLTU|nr:hypothetical protein KY289_036468 [Solanum tuberosum]KAH0738273.1 hypothetical protein KY290_036978 [Solanum tuberosum]